MLSLTPTDLPAKLDEGWSLLDVRTDEEWAAGHLAGAAHVPMDQVVARLDEIGDRVVCVCAVGARSEQVAQYLAAHGREVANLDGGLQAWVRAGGALSR